MTSAVENTKAIHEDALTNYLISITRAVEASVQRALNSLCDSASIDVPRRAETETQGGPGEIFLLEPRINELEMLIDDHAVRLLRDERLGEEEIRQVVATLKITNDLERMGDLAVNLAECIISLADMPRVANPPELKPMVEAVRAMVKKSLGALAQRNVFLAGEVLESDDLVDQYRDQIFERLMRRMAEQPAEVAPDLQLILTSRHLERIADHATNIAEDVIFWIRGLDVRHGRARVVASVGTAVTDNS